MRPWTSAATARPPVTDDYGEGIEDESTGIIDWAHVDLEDQEIIDRREPKLEYQRIMARQ